MMSILRFDIPAIILFLTCLGCVDYSDDGEMASQPLSPTPRLDLLVDDPPKDITDEEVVAEILTYYPRIGRSRSFQEYETIHHHAKRVLPIAVAMEKQFPSTDHMITHFGMWGGGDNIWNTESHFGGRYQLTMQVPIKIDYAADTFVISGPLNVWLLEARTCTRGGGTSYKIDGSGQRQFSEADMQKLITHNWDWGVVGVLDELSEIHSMDVVLPTKSGLEIRTRCVSKPTDHQQILLDRLGLNLPTKINLKQM